MTSLTFKLYYIWNLIRVNPTRFIFLFLGLTFLYFTGYNPKYTQDFKIVNQFKHADNYVYVYQDIHNNQIEYNSIISKTALPMKGDILTRTYTTGLNVIIWAGFIISIGVSIIICFVDDWDIEKVFRKTLSPFIEVELEDGEYYYFAFGRLLGKLHYKASNNDFGLDGLGDLRLCPKMQSKTMKRNSILEKLVG